MSILHDVSKFARRIDAAGRSVAMAALLGSVWMLPSVAAAFNLVTQQEARESAVYEAANPPSPFTARAIDPLGPRIEIVSPDLAAASLQSPLLILMKFQAASGAEILPETFRAQYGAFRIDITDRLVKATKVTREGIQVDRAELPSGSHRLLLKVQDSAERTGEREVRFTVAEPPR
jgi:hypothetical protein